ncbi:MAG: deoxyribose-phosphate aldolase [Planctomycetes bacterium]|nr:deoxyribose-phosphate aldolase [Planctomycetota bacterium]
MNPNAAEFARRIEHTCLAPEATSERIDQLCDEAVEYGFHGVCVNPIHVRRAAERLARACAGAGDGNAPIVISVAGFPLGACRTETKADEARRAMEDGAFEIDMVALIGAILDGDSSAVRRDIEAVAHAVHGAERPGLLKVILETAVLSDERIIMGCRACAEGEADFVKTSTGLHPAGGARVEHVRLLRRHASPIRVKAAGGIRDAAAAMAMIDAGADRIGTSSGVAIIQSLEAIGPTMVDQSADQS